jgi:hypothetical protein
VIGLTARYVSYEGYGEYYNEELKFSDFDQLEGGDGSVCGPCLPFTPPPPSRRSTSSNTVLTVICFAFRR